MPRSSEVDAWFDAYDNPMKAVVLAMREAILAADARVEECIKWQAPTFTYKGNIASFFPKSKKHASLMFHEGAAIPGRHALLKGEGKVGRQVKLGSVEAVVAARAELQAIVKAWIDLKDGSSEKKAVKKKAVKKKAVKKKAVKKKA